MIPLFMISIYTIGIISMTNKFSALNCSVVSWVDLSLPNILKWLTKVNLTLECDYWDKM